MKYFSKNKKWMAYLILLTFLFTSIMPTNLATGDSMAYAAEYTKTMEKGDVDTLSTSNRCYWKSDSPSVITVSSSNFTRDITIEAVGEGTATVTATRYGQTVDTWIITVTDSSSDSGDSNTDKNGIIFKFYPTVSDSVSVPYMNGIKFTVDLIDENGNKVALTQAQINSIPAEIKFTENYVGINEATFSAIDIEGYTFSQAYAYFWWDGDNKGEKYAAYSFENFGYKGSSASTGNYIGYTSAHGNGDGVFGKNTYWYQNNGTLHLVYYKVLPNAPETHYVVDGETTLTHNDSVEWASNGYVYYPANRLNVYTKAYMETNYPQKGEFVGWFEDQNCTKEVTDTFFQNTTTKDVYLYAKWNPHDSLAYDANSGNGTMAATTGYQGKTVTVAENSFTKAGYTFTEWNTQADGKGTSYDAGDDYLLTANDDKVYAQWTANNDTRYTVEHYLQNLNDDGYTLKDTEKLTGVTDAKATATAKTYEGFTFDDDSQLNVLSGTIAADGSLVLKLYYTRDSHKVTYEYNAVPGASALPAEATYKYGAEVTVAPNATAPGYTFRGWSTTDATVTDGKFAMPDKDVTLVGSFTANSDTPYKVQHWQQSLNADGTLANTYTLVETENLTGTTGKTVTATAKDYPGFTFNPNVTNTVQSGTITGDRNLVLKLYYDRNTVASNEAKILKTDANGNALAGAAFTFNGTTLEAIAPRSIIQTLAEAITGEDAVNNQYLIPMQLVYGVVYPVVETAAPAGYTGVAPFYVTLNADANALVLCDAEGKALDNNANVSITGLTITVKNTPNTDISYVVEYETADGTKLLADKTVEDQTMATTVTEKAAEIAGYTVDEASKSLKLAATGNVITFIYTPNTDTVYKVNHYLQNLNDNDYTLDGTENKTGTTATLTQAVAKDYDGFTVQPFEQEIIAGNGNTVVNIYYNRNSYDLTIEYRYESENGQQAAKPYQATLKYEDSYSVKSPAIAGFVADIPTVEGKMPAEDVHVTVVYVTAGDTPYTVNYYYQDRTGAYSTMFSESNKTTTGALVFAETTPNENHVTTPSLYAFNPYGFTTDKDGNTVKTNTQARVAADGSTVLNAFFDQKFRVIFKYADESMLVYNVIKDTGYVYGLGDAVVFPAFTEDMEEAVWTTEPDGGMEVSFIDAIDEDTVALFGEGDNTLVLYTKAKVKPLAVGDLVIRKVVTGDQAPAGASFNFTLEVKVNLPDKTLTAEEAKKLQGYNSDVIFAEKALDNAKADLRDAIAVFGDNAKATTVSAYEFIMTDDSDETLFGYTTTGSAYQYTTGSVYEFDAYDSFRVKGDKVEKGLLDNIIDFFKALAGAETQPTDSRDLLTMLAEKVNSTTNSAISFHITDAYNLMDAVKAFAEADAEYTKAEADRDSFLNEAGLAKWITINGERYDLVKVEGEDYYTTTGSMITFTLKDGESKGFTFDVTSGSTIRYVVTEVNDDKLVSVHEHDITLDDKGDQVWGNGILVDGKVAIGSITTGSAAGFTFTNAYGDKVITPPEIITPPNTPPYVPPTTPEEIIDDPEVPLDEPEVPEEPVIEPGEEIPEPEIPLGDAPATGDAANAVPFMVLMMLHCADW